MANNDTKREVGTVDLTPTYSALVPLYVAALRDGNDTARRACESELRRMARMCDALNVFVETEDKAALFAALRQIGRMVD